MKFKNALFISLFFHLLISYLFIFLNDFQISKNQISLLIQKGSNVEISNNILKLKFSGNDQKNDSNLKNTLFEGAKSDEVERIQNKLIYPPIALENGWESSCEWKVQIGQNNRIANVELVKKCKYKIFENEFLRVINDWNFRLPENTVINIPVNFKIQRE